MRRWINLNKNTTTVFVVIATFVIGAILLRSASGKDSSSKTVQTTNPKSNSPQSDPQLELTASQLNAIKIGTVGTYLFPVEKETVGTISFADDLSVQVFPPYQGRIIRSFVELGSNVEKEQPLYTIDSPDLIQAESALMAAAGTF
jgi:membrane fusion protein, heavy metal efflux system